MAILTVAREYGSGGREIAQSVAQSLEYEYVDKDRLMADLRAAGKQWEQWGSDLDESCPTIWEKYDWSFQGFGALLQQAVLGYALRDNVVIVGRGANFVLKGTSYSYNIRVIAPLALRLERIMERESMDWESARWLAEKTDRARSCFIYSLYGARWDDPSEYDEVFNTEKHSLSEIASLVEDALRSRDALKSENAVKMLRMREAVARVKAGILTNPAFFIPTLDVQPEGEGMVLRAVVHRPKERQRLEEEARKLAGDIPIHFQLHYRV